VTILLNTARDWARKTLRQPETLGLDAMTTLAHQETSVPARTATPEHTAAQAEVGRLVRLALDDLSPEFGY
jgi:DNA-directed RNA polymerase specialized sigma24 family protein